MPRKRSKTWAFASVGLVLGALLVSSSALGASAGGAASGDFFVKAASDDEKFKQIVGAVGPLAEDLPCEDPTATPATEFTWTVSDCEATVTGYVGSSRDFVIPSTYTVEGTSYPVTAISARAFQYDDQLDSAVIPDSVVRMGAYAFNGSSISSVTIGNSVESIEQSTFGETRLTSVVIPDSVVSIKQSAFQSAQLASVTLGNSVETIGGSAFRYNNLTSLVLPDSIDRIELYAFANNQINSVNLPSSLTHIGNWGFAWNNLTSVTIPNSMTEIETGAFGSNKLTSVIIPDSITRIHDEAFKDNLLTEITIPDSVTRIGKQSFNGNPGLIKVTMMGTAPEGSDGLEIFSGQPGFGMFGKNAALEVDLQSSSDPDSYPSIWYGYATVR